MAAHREQPWSNDEKNYLLAEIIKSVSPPPGVLYSVAENLNVQPHTVPWNDIALPPGRSLNSSRSAFEEIRRLPRSLGPMSLGPQTPLSAPPVALKRSFGLDAPYTGREIRPKLPAFPAAGTTAQPSTSEQPTKRRRGRPPKSQSQPKPPTPVGSSGEPSVASVSAAPQSQISPPAMAVAPSVVPAEEAKATLPPTTRMPISAVLTPTAPKAPSQSSSSSGKRRRGRSTRSEPEDLAQIMRPQGHEYESPYGRAEGGLEDTPARAAVLRHREEPIPSQPSFTGSEPDPQ